MALVAALNAYAYNFQQGDIITYNVNGSSSGTRFYNVFDVNMNYQTNIIIGNWSSATYNFNFTPEGAIATDGLHPCFWVAYGCTNAAGNSTNLMLRRYDSPTSWTDITSPISNVTETCAWSNQCLMTRGRDKFYIEYMAWVVLSTNYYTNRGGMGSVTMRVHNVVSYNFRNNTWGTPFMLLNSLGQVDQNATDTYFPGDHSITAGYNIWQMGYLASSNELFIPYDSGSVAHYNPDGATPQCWLTATVAWPPASMCSNVRGIGTFSATQLVCVSSAMVGAGIWSPYPSPPAANYAYQVMPNIGYGGGYNVVQIFRLANGQLLTGAAQIYFLCDPVTGNYTTNNCSFSGWPNGFLSFTQITWPARGTIVSAF
jgi:hypothetical protein